MKRGHFFVTGSFLKQIGAYPYSPNFRYQLLLPMDVSITGVSDNIPRDEYTVFVSGTGLPPECEGAGKWDNPELLVEYSSSLHDGQETPAFEGIKIAPPPPPQTFLRNLSDADGKCFWCHLEEAEHSLPERFCLREPQPLIPSNQP